MCNEFCPVSTVRPRHSRVHSWVSCMMWPLCLPVRRRNTVPNALEDMDEKSNENAYQKVSISNQESGACNQTNCCCDSLCQFQLIIIMILNPCDGGATEATRSPAGRRRKRLASHVRLRPGSLRWPAAPCVERGVGLEEGAQALPEDAQRERGRQTETETERERGRERGRESVCGGDGRAGGCWMRRQRY